jgi:hypothetical protein
MRPKSFTLTDTSPASATSATSAGYAGGLQYFDTLTIISTLQGGTGGNLSVYLQTTFDDGVTWFDFAHYQTISAGASAATNIWHVHRSTAVTAATTIGSGTSPALAVNTINGGAFGDRIRVLYVAGAGTSAGASQTVRIIANSINRN